MGSLLLVAGIGLAIHALSEARGDVTAAPVVSTVLAVGALISGAILLARR